MSTLLPRAWDLTEVELLHLSLTLRASAAHHVPATSLRILPALRSGLETRNKRLRTAARRVPLGDWEIPRARHALGRPWRREGRTRQTLGVSLRGGGVLVQRACP